MSGVSIVKTRLGAPAVLDHRVGEVMHPVVGPAREAAALYLSPSRLRERLVGQGGALVLLDVGLGAGSNAAVAFAASEERSEPGRPLAIISFDRSVEALELALGARSPGAFALGGVAGRAAREVLERGEARAPHTRWRLVRGELPETLRGEPAVCAEIVYWDPFSPRANPSLWTTAAFSALRRLCAPSATVHTYSGSTAVRSALLLAGFAVGRGPSTGEKSETTIASPSVDALEQPLGARFLDRLRRSTAPLPSDAPPGALERIAASPQFR